MALFEQLKQKEELQDQERKRNMDYNHMAEMVDQKRLEREESEKMKRLK